MQINSGAGAAKLLPPSLKQAVVGELISIGAATGANAAINQAPVVAESVSNSLQNAGQAMSNAAEELYDMVQPKPAFDIPE